jgi:hypothetical protein
MAIQYTEKSMLFTESGWYLVAARWSLLKPPELTIARYEASSNHWEQSGIDYDVWTLDSGTVALEVICKLDLESIAAGVKQITDASEKRRIVAIFDIWPGFENSPLSWFAETISSRMTDAVSLKFAEITDTQEVERKVRGTT